MTQPIPRYWESVDWAALERDYPPPPEYAMSHGRLSADELAALQERRFLERIGQAWQAPFYRKRWTEAGLAPGDIRGLDDLDRIPTFTSDDLKESIAAAPPFGEHYASGSLPATPLKIQTSGGTTGMPRPTLFDPVAWEVQAIQMARAFYAQGARPGDIAQITYTNALGNAAWNAYTAMHHWMGVIPLTTGTGLVTPSERQLEYAETMGTAWWFARGEYLGRLTQVAEQTGFDLRQRLRTRFLHSYLGPDHDGSLRGLLQQAWGVPVYDNYGTHEIGLVAFECQAQDDKHLNEDTVILQTVDVDSGEATADGEQGAVVATSLHRSVPPVIRYNLRDLMILRERTECGCGLRGRKLSMFLGRADEMVKLRGTNVYPVACQTAINHDHRTSGDYICVAYYVGEGLGRREEMVVQVERRSSGVDADALRRDLERALHRDLGVHVNVAIVDPGTLAEFTRLGSDKVRRLRDLRGEGAEVDRGQLLPGVRAVSSA
jgi:phenylacetate-CoA ligase